MSTPGPTGTSRQASRRASGDGSFVPLGWWNRDETDDRRAGPATPENHQIDGRKIAESPSTTRELAVNDRSRPSRVQLGACSFDPARAELLGPNGEPVHLRPQSMRVLETLLAHSGTVVTREALTATVWPGVVVTDDSLVQCVRDIRRALGEDHRLLHTVPRVGYRLDLAL